MRVVLVLALTVFGLVAAAGRPVAAQVASVAVVADEPAQVLAGKRAAEAGRYRESLDIIRPLAERGNASAQRELGELYEDGHGITQDYAAALSWYRKAAERGDPVALQNLGWCYQLGHGVPVDFSAAMGWYHKAADQGVGEAFFRIGMLYKDGRGVERDDAAAAEWIQRAADRDLFTAQLMLGGQYMRDEDGATPDYIAAYKWLSLAAAHGAEPGSAVTLLLDSLTDVMTAEQVAEAEKQIRAWKPLPHTA